MCMSLLISKCGQSITECNVKVYSSRDWQKNGKSILWTEPITRRGHPRDRDKVGAAIIISRVQCSQQDRCLYHSQTCNRAAIARNIINGEKAGRIKRKKKGRGAPSGEFMLVVHDSFVTLWKHTMRFINFIKLYRPKISKRIQSFLISFRHGNAFKRIKIFFSIKI